MKTKQKKKLKSNESTFVKKNLLQLKKYGDKIKILFHLSILFTSKSIIYLTGLSNAHFENETKKNMHFVLFGTLANNLKLVERKKQPVAMLCPETNLFFFSLLLTKIKSVFMSFDVCFDGTSVRDSCFPAVIRSSIAYHILC